MTKVHKYFILLVYFLCFVIPFSYWHVLTVFYLTVFSFYLVVSNVFVVKKITNIGWPYCFFSYKQTVSKNIQHTSKKMERKKENRYKIKTDSSYLIVVFCQPMPCCFGLNLHYSGTRAEGSDEREHLLACHTLIYNTIC